MKKVNLNSLSVNGITMHWQEKGEGKAIVLMPGAIGDYRSWTNQMDDFSKRHRVIALSRRYAYPDKYVPAGDGSINPCMDDLLCLMKHLGLEKISLVGHSYGGYICLVFAHKYPDLVDKLVLEEPTIFPYITNNPQNPLKLLPLAIKDFGAAKSFFKLGFSGLRPCKTALAKGEFDAARMYFFNAICEGKMKFEEANPLLQVQLRDNIEAFQGENNPFVFPFGRKQIRQVKTPTLVLEGDQSPRFFGYICEQLQKDLPNVLLKKFKSPTHWLHLDLVEAFNKTVLEFIDI